MTLARTILNKLNETDDSQDFESALQKFIDKLNAEFKKANVDFPKFKDGYYKDVEIKKGKVYVKVLRIGISSESVYCFIEIATGKIYKPATFNAPAKGARGDIYKPETYKNLDVHGGWLYKNLV